MKSWWQRVGVCFFAIFYYLIFQGGVSSAQASLAEGIGGGIPWISGKIKTKIEKIEREYKKGYPTRDNPVVESIPGIGQVFVFSHLVQRKHNPIVLLVVKQSVSEKINIKSIMPIDTQALNMSGIMYVYSKNAVTMERSDFPDFFSKKGGALWNLGLRNQEFEFAAGSHSLT